MPLFFPWLFLNYKITLFIMAPLPVALPLPSPIKLRGEVVGIFSWKGAVVSQGHMMLQGESLDAVRRWSLSQALYKADA